MTEQTIQKMIALLKEHGWKIAAAESCTGGLLSAAITSAPGASEVLEGSIISYANRIKQALLGVDGQILDTCGAVSAPCAKAMASGVREKMGADIGVSVTGIAGPGGGTPQKPVGTVFIGVSTNEDQGQASAKEFHFTGSRAEIRQASVEQALAQALAAIEAMAAAL